MNENNRNIKHKSIFKYIFLEYIKIRAASTQQLIKYLNSLLYAIHYFVNTSLTQRKSFKTTIKYIHTQTDTAMATHKLLFPVYFIIYFL